MGFLRRVRNTLSVENEYNKIKTSVFSTIKSIEIIQLEDEYEFNILSCGGNSQFETKRLLLTKQNITVHLIDKCFCKCSRLNIYFNKNTQNNFKNTFKELFLCGLN